ncbi:MAG: MFS transporter [Anaeromyxobacteraceae bacterium]
MLEKVTRVFRGLPGLYWVLFGGVALMALATFVFPFLALFLTARGYSVEEAGLLVSLFGAGSIPAGPIAGTLADRLGRRPTLVGALVAGAACTAALPFLEHPAVVAAGVLVLGVAIHAYFPAANAIVADVVPRERLGDAYGLMYWERNAGIAISFALGGALAARGYGLLFLADAATTFLFALVAWRFVPETRPAGAAAAGGGAPRGYGVVLRDRRFVALMALALLWMVGLFQFMVALPVHMRAIGLDEARYGAVMAVNGAIILLLSPWAGRLGEAFDPAKVLAAGALLTGTGYGAYAVCTTPLQYAAATAVWSLGEVTTIPTLPALVAQLAPPDLRGRYQGALGTTFGTALAVAPALSGVVLGRLGAHAVWTGTAALCLVVAAGHLAAGRARP